MNARPVPIDINDTGLIDLGEEYLGEELKNAVRDCISAQKAAAENELSGFISDDNALDKCSPAALENLLAEKKDIHGLATHRSISNGICFGSSHIEGAVIDEQVSSTRQVVDHLVRGKVNELFDSWKDLSVSPSGAFWYPRECSMGWHTNSKAPGWRIYINYADTEGESFFRYQDPETKEIITLSDNNWNFRVFKVSAEKPLWHCIYSNTNRFSLGYIVRIPSNKGAIVKKFRKLIGRGQAN